MRKQSKTEDSSLRLPADAVGIKFTGSNTFVTQRLPNTVANDKLEGFPLHTFHICSFAETCDLYV